MMLNFVGPVEARSFLMDYLYDREQAIPDDVRDGLRDYLKVVSPVKAVIECVKLVFDRQPECPSELQEWAAASAIMCANYGFDQITPDMAETLLAGAVV